jgi:hypothetical protein
MKHRADIDGPEQRTADAIERSQERYQPDIDDGDVAGMLGDAEPEISIDTGDRDMTCEVTYRRRPNGTIEIISEKFSDPTPYCSGCGAMQKSRCHCGPIAENE